MPHLDRIFIELTDIHTKIIVHSLYMVMNINWLLKSPEDETGKIDPSNKDIFNYNRKYYEGELI